MPAIQVQREVRRAGDNQRRYVQRSTMIEASGPFQRRRGKHTLRLVVAEDGCIDMSFGFTHALEQAEIRRTTREAITDALHHARGINPATFEDLVLFAEYLTPAIDLLPGESAVLDSGRLLTLTHTAESYTITLVNARPVVAPTLPEVWRLAAAAIYS